MAHDAPENKLTTVHQTDLHKLDNPYCTHHFLKPHPALRTQPPLSPCSILLHTLGSSACFFPALFSMLATQIYNLLKYYAAIPPPLDLVFPLQQLPLQQLRNDNLQKLAAAAAAGRARPPQPPRFFPACPRMRPAPGFFITTIFFFVSKPALFFHISTHTAAAARTHTDGPLCMIKPAPKTCTCAQHTRACARVCACTIRDRTHMHTTRLLPSSPSPPLPHHH